MINGYDAMPRRIGFLPAFAQRWCHHRPPSLQHHRVSFVLSHCRFLFVFWLFFQHCQVFGHPNIATNGLCYCFLIPPEWEWLMRCARCVWRGVNFERVGEELEPREWKWFVVLISHNGSSWMKLCVLTRDYQNCTLLCSWLCIESQVSWFQWVCFADYFPPCFAPNEALCSHKFSTVGYYCLSSFMVSCGVWGGLELVFRSK